MNISKDCLSIYAKKAQTLEQKFNQHLSKQQLWQIAQEAAYSYHNLVNNLAQPNQKQREVLTKLSHQFSQIEYQAINRFYGNTSGPTREML